MLGAPPFFAVCACNLSLWVNSSWQIEGRSHPCTVRVVTEGLSRYKPPKCIHDRFSAPKSCRSMFHQPWGPSKKSMEQFDKASQQAGFFVFSCQRWQQLAWPWDHVCHLFDRPPEVFLILAAFNFYLDGTRYTWKMWTDVVAVVILATIHLIRAILHPTQILMPLIFALGFFGLWVLLLDSKMVDAQLFVARVAAVSS